MIQPFKAKAEGLLVLTFEGAHDFKIGNALGNAILTYTNKGYEAIKPLPTGDWELLGMSNQLTEQQLEMIVSGNELFKLYADYSYMDKPYRFGTRQESWNSLLESVNCYHKNPYGERPDISCYPVYDEGINGLIAEGFEYDLAQWQEAQERTGVFAVLIKKEKK